MQDENAWKRFSDDGYKHYDVTEVGFKYNMMDLQAAIGMHQITRIEKYWNRRLEIWEQYSQAFSGLPISLPAPLDRGSRHALHLYTILINKTEDGLTRDQFVTKLHQRDIGTGVHYRAIPVHPVYRERFGWNSEDYPRAVAVGNSTVSLPLSARELAGMPVDFCQPVAEHR